eukprot:12060992-Alexandrium_andersonii.AAC.1
MAFTPTRAQATETLQLREEALTEVVGFVGAWFQPAALFPAEPTFWMLLDAGRGEEAPLADTIRRLRAVEGSLDGPEEERLSLIHI